MGMYLKSWQKTLPDFYFTPDYPVDKILARAGAKPVPRVETMPLGCPWAGAWHLLETVFRLTSPVSPTAIPPNAATLASSTPESSTPLDDKPLAASGVAPTQELVTLLESTPIRS